MDDVNKNISEYNHIKIDIIADVICPWCFIGYQIIKKVITNEKYQNVKLNWIPFILDSSIPLTGQKRKNYLINKFGSKHYLIEDNINKFARKNNIIINLDKLEVMPNTKKLHNIIISDNKINMKLEVAEEIMKKIFVEGRDLSQEIEINQIIDKYKIQYNNNNIILIQKHTPISGVPLFIFNNKWKISGVQNYKIFKNVFELSLLDLSREFIN